MWFLGANVFLVSTETWSAVGLGIIWFFIWLCVEFRRIALKIDTEPLALLHTEELAVLNLAGAIAKLTYGHDRIKRAAHKELTNLLGNMDRFF